MTTPTTTTPAVTGASPTPAPAPQTQAKVSATPPTRPLAQAPSIPPAAKTSPVGPTHEVPSSVDPLLVQILSWPRRHDTHNEKLFTSWLSNELVKLGRAPKVHSEGALSVSIPLADGKHSTSLFSCHVDTCDGGTVPLGARKRLAYDPNFGTIFLDKDSPGDCLGADDGVGVWLMLKMIEAKKPGTYLFHRGEECGGISAKAIAAKEKDWLSKFELAVAFDRPRTNEIITHQGGLECASDKFAKALSAALNEHGLDYAPSARGVYTDTKEYRRIIAECINVGVGYESQHGRAETQDYAHLTALLAAITAIDWDALPVDRDPSKAQVYAGYQGYYSPGAHTDFTKNWKDRQRELDDFDKRFDDAQAFNKKTPPKKKAKGKSQDPQLSLVPTVSEAEDLVQELQGMNIDDVRYVIENEPDNTLLIVMELLRQNARMQADINQLNILLGV